MDAARAEPPAGLPGKPSRTTAYARLTKRADFLAAGRGRRFHTERMTVQGRPRAADDAGTTLEGPRIGLTVTKRVGHATERNRIKRRLRRAVAEALRAETERRACDIVVVARRACLDTPYPQIVEDLSRAFSAVSAPRARKGETSSRPPRNP